VYSVTGSSDSGHTRLRQFATLLTELPRFCRILKKYPVIPIPAICDLAHTELRFPRPTFGGSAAFHPSLAGAVLARAAVPKRNIPRKSSPTPDLRQITTAGEKNHNSLEGKTETAGGLGFEAAPNPISHHHDGRATASWLINTARFSSEEIAGDRVGPGTRSPAYAADCAAPALALQLRTVPQGHKQW